MPEYDETHYARLAAKRFETIHEEFRVEPKAVEILPRLVWHFDEPFADSSALPTWYLAELTRQHVTVALSGDGGDELFAGYPRYGAVWLADMLDRWPAVLRWLAVGSYWQMDSVVVSAEIPPAAVETLRRRFFSSAGAAVSGVDLDLWRGPPGVAVSRGASGAAAGRRPAGVSHRRRCCALRGRDAVTAVSLADLLTYLPCDLMTKVDTASMAFGLECRQPFLDHRVVELAARMPASEKFRRGRGKQILRETFADLLPPPIRRRRKMGFGVPLDHWFRHEMRDFAREVLFDPQTQSRGFFRPEAVQQLFRRSRLRPRRSQSAVMVALIVGTLAAGMGGPFPADSHCSIACA